MKDVTADTAKKTDQKGDEGRKIPSRAEERIALHRCYGEIGIPAVAAAARYQGPGKNSAYAPTATGLQDCGEAVA